MKLYDIINNYPLIDTYGSLDIEISTIKHDSRQIDKSDLFIAQKGFNNDGHNFIKKAIKNGAIAVLGENHLNKKGNITQIKVNDSVDALAYLSSNFYNWPSKKMNMIGITGTNGKTSVSYYIKKILDTYKLKVGVLGTIGATLDSETINLKNTTPDSLVIQELLNRMVRRGIDTCIMEASSHALDLKRVEYIDFDIGIFTNLSQDHLDYHGTMERYFESKLSLFKKTKKFNIINIDDKYGKIINESVQDRVSCITYGLKESAMVYASNITYSDKGIKFVLNTPKASTDIKLNIPGEFSLYNALAASACSYVLGIDIKTIKRGLESFYGVKGRFEFVPNKLGLNIIIDFAHTPEGLEAILKTTKEFVKGKIYIVLGAGGNRDKEKRPKMGEVVGQYADLSIITTDNPRFEDPEYIIDHIVKGVKKTNGKYVKIVDRRDAIEYAILQAEEEDIILLAGKGHETNMIIGEDSVLFNERKIVSDIMDKF
ncbi:MAG TPA: UDP-N-acetylmuramoyl-L-alanyl-D-glutamate--2,6-diaminopimelate ligase [Tissierellaceae bacterium]|nr:UDP-N-acetylmuramoyl-L-alanyl-D-glutamate--2,6-diaminopimelate ligase [Tissierellaceae bacterium]